MGAVADPRADTHPAGTLADELFGVARLGTCGVGARHHVEPQQLCQPQGVHLVVLELGVADDAHLERVGHDDFLDPVDGAVGVVEDVPVHGGLEDCLAATAELADEALERGGVIVLDAAFPSGRAVIGEDMDLAEALVRVDADVIVCGGFHGLPCRLVDCAPATLSRAGPTRSPFIPTEPIQTSSRDPW